MAEQLHEIVYCIGPDGPQEINRVLVERRFWSRDKGRLYLGSINITDLLTGTPPKFAISEDE